MNECLIVNTNMNMIHVSVINTFIKIGHLIVCIIR